MVAVVITSKGEIWDEFFHLINTYASKRNSAAKHRRKFIYIFQIAFFNIFSERLLSKPK
jgi:hypothetical protein